MAKGTSPMDQVLEQKGHGGYPDYCKRCRGGPRRLHAITMRGILIAKVCSTCLDAIESGEPLSKPTKQSPSASRRRGTV